MSQRQRSNMYIARTVACAVVLMGTSVQAQPPLEVQWMSELSGLPQVLSAFVDPNNGETEVIYADNGPDGCTYEEFAVRYDLNGLAQGFGWGECLNAGATHDQYATGTSRVGFPILHILNACDLNVINCYIWCNGAVIAGVTTGSPSYSHASANCVLADGSSVYIGGGSSNCSPTTWWSVFKLGGGALWPSCVPASPKSLEATEDSILSIAFPAVHMVDKVAGNVGSTFDLFSGTASYAGKSCINGDTLYWACKVDGSLHVGKYLLDQGSLWEQTLPFTGDPVELMRDNYGRLWTAVGNNVIWLDTDSGSFVSDTIGEAILGLDLQAGALVVAGTMSTNVNFIMHGTPQP